MPECMIRGALEETQVSPKVGGTWGTSSEINPALREVEGSVLATQANADPSLAARARDDNKSSLTLAVDGN